MKCKIKSCLAPCAISTTLPLSSCGAHLVTSLTSVTNPYPFLVPLNYLGAIYLSFEYLFSEKKNLLCPCKRAVTWSCKIEISYMS